MSHARVLLTVIHRALMAPVSTLLNIFVIGIALSLPVGLYVLVQNGQALVSHYAASPQLSLFMKLDSRNDDITLLRKRLEQHPAVDHIEFVSRAQALEQLRKDSGLGDVIGGIDHNPLPDTFIVYPKLQDAKQLESLRDEFSHFPKLAHVQLDSEWARRLEALLDFSRILLLLLATLLAIALVAITFNTIRLQILTRRDEIEVSQLIGATSGFIHRPFLYFGTLQGLLGGLAAWGIITASIYLLNSSLAELSRLYASGFSLTPLSISDSFALLGFAAFLGWFGAWLSVSQHLRKNAPHR